MFVSLFLILFLFIFVSGCPHGWVQHGSLCYFFSKDPAKSWAEASSYCHAFAYKLAEPDSPGELEFIKTQLAKSSATKPYFIGGSDLFVEGEWIWSTTQTLVASHNWEPGEPNNVGPGENCLSVNPDGLWNDLPCNLTAPYICEAENAGSMTIG